MHATMETTCVDDILVAHPVLQALFTFLQMHFLFVNSQVSTAHPTRESYDSENIYGGEVGPNTG